MGEGLEKWQKDFTPDSDRDFNETPKENARRMDKVGGQMIEATDEVKKQNVVEEERQDKEVNKKLVEATVSMLNLSKDNDFADNLLEQLSTEFNKPTMAEIRRRLEEK
jgi:hypothetical protein